MSVQVRLTGEDEPDFALVLDAVRTGCSRAGLIAAPAKGRGEGIYLKVSKPLPTFEQLMGDGAGGLRPGRRVNPRPEDPDFFDWSGFRAPTLSQVSRRCSVISIDTETTGLSHSQDEILQIGIVDAWTGETLLDTYVRPEHHEEWPEAEAVNGISPDMVSDAPTAAEVADRVQEIVWGARLVIAYNAPFDMPFLRHLGGAGVSFAGARVEDVMVPYARVYGEWDDCHGDWKWQKLVYAAEQVGYDWAGEKAHGAVADARACAAVWRWMQENCIF